MRATEQIFFPQIVPSSINVQVFLSVKPDDVLRVAWGMNNVIKSGLFKWLYLWEASNHPTLCLYPSSLKGAVRRHWLMAIWEQEQVQFMQTLSSLMQDHWKKFHAISIMCKLINHWKVIFSSPALLK